MNNRRKTFMKRLISIVGILFISSLFLRCELALGPSVSIKGPVLTILAPAPNRSIGETDPSVGVLFNLSGTVKDQLKIVRMEVTLQYYNKDVDPPVLVDMGRQWLYDNGWQIREDKNDPWQPYTEANYDSMKEDDKAAVNPPSWTVSGDTVLWNLPVLLSRMDKGDYFITVNSWDSAGHNDSNSIRKLKVFFNNLAPSLKIKSPVPIYGGGSLSEPLPPGFSTLKYDPFNDPEGTYAILSKVVNRFPNFSWAIDTPVFTGGFNLKFEFTNQFNLDDPNDPQKVVYYGYEWDDANGSLPQQGVHSAVSGPLLTTQVAGYSKAGGEIKLDPALGFPNDKITPIQFVSRLTDSLGNEEYQSKGWFLYLPDSHKPYVDIHFGYKVPANTPKDQIPLDAPERATITRGREDALNMAYDDGLRGVWDASEGLDYVEWKLYKLKASGLDPVDETAAQYDGSLNKPWTDKIDLQTTRAAWGWTALGAFGVGRFKIEVWAVDKEGVRGDRYDAYFTITSNSTPTVRVMDNPSANNLPLWGGGSGNLVWDDSSGDFTIQGKAQVEDSDNWTGAPDVKVDRISIAWIKPGSGFAESMIGFRDINNPVWDSAVSVAAAGGSSPVPDANGNKVWELRPNTDFHFVLSSAGNNNGVGQEDWEFQKQLNYFTDLDVGQTADGKNPSTSQTFIIRVYSVGTGKALSSTYEFTILGDTEAPKVEVTQLIVTKQNGDVKKYPADDALINGRRTADFDMISAIDAGDTLKIRGYWSDDSFDNWSGLEASARLGLIQNFTVHWEGENLSKTFTLQPKAGALGGNGFGYDGTNGIWETEFTFDANNEDPIINLNASLTDLNNNTGRAGHTGEGETLIVETDNPTLIRISSLTSDGRYGDNSRNTDPHYPNASCWIDIFLDFNKQVKFFKGDSSGNLDISPANPPPYLVLNNAPAGGKEARAFYYNGNGSNRLVFRYFIDGLAAPPSSELIPFGALPGYGGGSSPGRLNVTGIVWNGYQESDCVSVDGDTRVAFSASVFNAGNNLSLAGGKNIIVDKDPPLIYNIVTTAGTLRPQGKGSPIYITLNFDKPVKVENATADNFQLKLKGGNLPAKSAVAKFANVAGAASVSFLYTVGSGHDTSSYPAAKYLGIDSVAVTGTALSVTDMAGNPFDPAGALANAVDTNTKQGILGNVVIDTTPPAAPLVSGITAQSYYTGTQTFSIAELEGNYVTVEYNLNYNPAMPDDGWNTVNSAPKQDPGSGKWSVDFDANNTPLKINGTYTIAARQYDNATAPNVSAPSAAVGPVKIDAGPLLVRLGSGATPDGIYGAGGEIKIDLEFRIPVYVQSGTLTSTNVALNVPDGSGGYRTAGSPVPSSDNRIWTFTYNIQQGDLVDLLDVSALNLNNYFYDSQSGGTRVNGYINLGDVIPSNRFNAQKSITVLSGYPAAINTTMDSGFKFPGNELTIEFNRNIYKGDTEEPLVIRQIAGAQPQTAANNGYRIPVVLSETTWSNLFIGRIDLASVIPDTWAGTNADDKALYWRSLGESYYQKGSNGAALANSSDSNNALVTDTTVKYVLNYTINPLDDSTGTLRNVGEIKNVLREAEALKFDVRDREVTIENDSQGRPRILRIALSGGKALPVKGASYEFSFPNGYVKDFLESPNGGELDTPNTGTDTALSSGAGGIALLAYPGTEAPLIRIKKGEDSDDIRIPSTGNAATDFSNVNRQAFQPLQSEARIDCRSPGTSLEYRIRQTTDNVGRLIWRASPAAIPNRLPNLGNQTPNDMTSFNQAKLRPQSGNSAAPNSYPAPGLDLWSPMGNYPAGFTGYTSPIPIGTTSYNDGGMEININARVVGAAVQAYEAAYRSVFVFNNGNINANRLLDIGQSGGTGNNAPLPVQALGRMWIRGGDTASGDPSVPDFPISRDRSLWHKARLMTPINAGVFGGSLANATSVNTTNNMTNTFGAAANSSIPSTYASNGQYVWFWVTWKINVMYTYIDPYCGQLPSATGDLYPGYDTPRYTKDLYMAYVPFKEHYPLIRGRTTVIEPRQVYGTLVDGPNGELNFGAVATSPAKRD